MKGEKELIILHLAYTKMGPGGLMTFDSTRQSCTVSRVSDLLTVSFIRTDDDGEEDGPYKVGRMRALKCSGYREYELMLVHENAGRELPLQ